MIEFKADCGHTVRARDEDSGKVVRCSYCGREARVPEQTDDDGLAGLFADVEKSGEYAPVSDRERVKRMKRKPSTPGGIAGPNAQMAKIRSVITKLIVFGIIACVLIIIGKTVWKQLQAVNTTPTPANQPNTQTPKTHNKPTPKPKPTPTRGLGLLNPRPSAGGNGVVVLSVPEGAEVYICEEDERLTSVLDDITWKATGVTGRAISLQPGKYDVYVAIQVGDVELMRYTGYRDLRMDLENGSSRSKLSSFFIPDGAVLTRVDNAEYSLPVLVRKYTCQVKRGRWTPIVAMFLPQVDLVDLLDFVPESPRFGFNEEAVTIELNFRMVPEKDQKHMMAILKRIGAVVYHSEKSRDYRLFGINPESGDIYSMKVKPPSAR